MNPVVQKLWAQALRSKKYKQCRGALRTHDCFCVMGLLCELYRQETDGPDWSIYGTGKHCFYLGHSGFLPPVVAEWAGLQDDRRGSIKERKVGPWDVNNLSDGNDAGLNFDQLATIVENEL